MKRPWIVFTGMCSVVMGIVLFCVVAGGYSSLMRAQNRINTVKQMLTEECSGQVGLALDLAKLPDEVLPPPKKEALVKTTRQLKSVLIRMTASKDPLDPDLIQNFETVQSEITLGIDAVLSALKEGTDLPKKDLAAMVREQTEHNTAVIVMVRQYNKEAAYFNTRSTQFPGIYIARIFSLDHLHFQAIVPPAPLPSSVTGETASAS